MGQMARSGAVHRVIRNAPCSQALSDPNRIWRPKPIRLNVPNLRKLVSNFNHKVDPLWTPLSRSPLLLFSSADRRYVG